MFEQKIHPRTVQRGRAVPPAAPGDAPAIIAEARTLWEESQALIQDAEALLSGPGLIDLRIAGRLREALDGLSFHGPRLLAPPSEMALTVETATARRDEVARRMAHLQEALTRDRQALVAAREQMQAAQARRRGLAQEVRAPIDGSLGATLAQAREQLGEAEAEAAEARGRLEAHEQTPPANRAATAEWARQLGTLRDELAGYDLLVARARGEAEQAEGAYRAALTAAWDAREAEAREAAAQVERDGEAAIAAALAAVEAARETLRVQRLAAMERASEIARARVGA